MPIVDAKNRAALPILRLLTFGVVVCATLGNSAKFGWRCQRSKKATTSSAPPPSPPGGDGTFTAANLIRLQRRKVWLNCSEPRIRAFRHAVTLLHDIRDAQPGSKTNQTQKRSFFGMQI